MLLQFRAGAARRWACMGLLYGAVNGCQASLELDEYVFAAEAQRCTDGALRCNGGGTQTCGGGSWRAVVLCDESTPICNNGQCASLRLSGGLSSTGPVSSLSQIRLLDPSLGSETVSCARLSDSRVCLTGQLGP